MREPAAAVVTEETADRLVLLATEVGRGHVGFNDAMSVVQSLIHISITSDLGLRESAAVLAVRIIAAFQPTFAPPKEFVDPCYVPGKRPADIIEGCRQADQAARAQPSERRTLTVTRMGMDAKTIMAVSIALRESGVSLDEVEKGKPFNVPEGYDIEDAKLRLEAAGATVEIH
jgi:hypothetical protein